ncbi:MAG: hypothetical protein IJ733_15390, partial [Lachnospiraceae bacterium]|nr:hypothetical protein [Lachnospiraceae bacterium]
MEQKDEKNDREYAHVLGEKLLELQGLIGKYKETHCAREELDRIEKIESSLAASLETLYDLAGLLEVPVTLENVRKSDQLLSYSGAANALFSDYEVIYYVDVETGHYVEYSTPGNYEQLKLEKRGTDFFSDLYRNIKKVVYEKDQAYVTNALAKESLFQRLTDGQVFSVRYRLMIDGEPMYYQSRVVYPESGQHMIIGICSVDRLTDRDPEADLDFSNIARALTNDYDRIYFVNMEDESYIRYTTDKGSELKASSSGSSFFEEVQKITSNIIYKKDADRLREVFQKKHLVEELKRWEMLSMTYRILMKGVP